MERPNITEERFDEILTQSSKLKFIIDIICSDFEPHEVYLIISLLFNEQMHHHSNGNEEEMRKNLFFTKNLLAQKQAAMMKKNG